MLAVQQPDNRDGVAVASIETQVDAAEPALLKCLLELSGPVVVLLDVADDPDPFLLCHHARPTGFRACDASVRTFGQILPLHDRELRPGLHRSTAEVCRVVKGTLAKIKRVQLIREARLRARAVLQ